MIVIKIMIELFNTLLTASIAVLLGILGAYMTSWEQDLYFEYLKYITPPIGVSAIFFLFIDQQISLILAAIFIMGLSWYYSTKLWFKKK
jgi:energy-converting hydrogenase Eha subunit E